jgi:hypothetical protein
VTRVAYVTAGTVGAGHFVRGAAILRALSRENAKVEYRMFGPRLPFACAREYPYEEVAFVAEELIDPRRAKKSAIAEALSRWAPSLLIVDLFWAPLRYVLPLPGVEAWLLLRKTPPEWLRGPARAPFDRAQYRRMIAIEPMLEIAGAESFEPIVAVERDEVSAAKRERVELAVVHAGESGELEQLLAALSEAERAKARTFDLRREDARFPLSLHIDPVQTISAAGYNSYWESRWLERTAATRFVPFARRIDDQNWRVRACASHVMRENGAGTLARAIIGART